MNKHYKSIFFLTLALIIVFPLFMTTMCGCATGGSGGGITLPSPVYTPPDTPSTPVPPTPTPTPTPTAAKYAYVSLTLDAGIDVFNADTFTWVKKMTGVSSPYRMCFSNAKRADGGPKYLYVADLSDVKRFDLTTQKWDNTWAGIGTIYSFDIDITPDDKYLYIMDLGAHKVVIEDVVLQTVYVNSPVPLPVLSSPLECAITPDGSKLIVADHGYGPSFGDSYYVPILTISSNTLVRLPTLEGSPASVAIHPNGSYAYILMSNTGKVAVVNIAGNTITKHCSIAVDILGVVISPKGDYAYMTNFTDNNVSVVAITDSGATLTEVVKVPLPAGAGPRDPGISPDGRYVWVPCDDNKVYVIDANTNTVCQTLNLSGGNGGSHVLIE